MKIINKSILILFVLIISFSCAKEEMIKVNPDFILSFQRDGKTDAYAGSTFYVIPTGSGEFLTLYNGTEGHVWGQPGAKGVDFNKADSLGVLYNTAGKYVLTLVSTSTGEFGEQISREVKSVEINTVDDRNSFTVFNINGVDGDITANNDINFSVPDIVTEFNFKAIFVLESELAKAYVNGVEQVSDVTINDFSQPVIYTVKSSVGSEKQYTVKFTTYPSSSEKQLTKFALGTGGYGEVGVIDETNKIISLTANYATNISSVRLVLESSYGSKIYLNNVLYSNRSNYNLSNTGLNQVKTIKVVAQDNSEVVYTLNTVADKPVSRFTFAGLVPAPQGVIDAVAKTITVDVLNGTDVTKLVAIWTGSVGKVTIGTTVQTNGVTSNNFSTPKTYTFYKGSTAGDKYVVTVNVK